MTYIAASVACVTSLSPHMIRVTFYSEQLRTMTDAPPDGFIKMFFPVGSEQRPQLPPPLVDWDVRTWYRGYLAMSADIRPPMRSYTVRAFRPEQAQLDVDFVVHAADGPGCQWVLRAAPGDEVAFIRPRGSYSPPERTDWHLIVGDETAVPAIGRIVENLAEGTRATVFAEVQGPEEEHIFDTLGKVEFHWIHRGQQHGKRLLSAVETAEFGEGQPYAWIAGEAGLVQRIRRHLTSERGMDKDAITFTGYWREGLTEDQTAAERARRAETGSQT